MNNNHAYISYEGQSTWMNTKNKVLSKKIDINSVKNEIFI